MQHRRRYTPVAPYGAGAGYDVLGAYRPLFWGCVVISVGVAGLVLLVRDAPPEPEAAPSVATA